MAQILAEASVGPPVAKAYFGGGRAFPALGCRKLGKRLTGYSWQKK